MTFNNTKVMKASFNKLLHTRVDPIFFAFVCLILLLFGIVATALSNDVSVEYDPALAWLSVPHNCP